MNFEIGWSLSLPLFHRRIEKIELPKGDYILQTDVLSDKPGPGQKVRLFLAETPRKMPRSQVEFESKSTITSNAEFVVPTDEAILYVAIKDTGIVNVQIKRRG